MNAIVLIDMYADVQEEAVELIDLLVVLDAEADLGRAVDHTAVSLVPGTLAELRAWFGMMPSTCSTNSVERSVLGYPSSGHRSLLCATACIIGSC